MGQGAYRHEKKYYRHDMGLSLNSTGDILLFKIDIEISKMTTGDIVINYFLKIDMPYWGPPSRDPSLFDQAHDKRMVGQTISLYFNTISAPEM